MDILKNNNPSSGTSLTRSRPIFLVGILVILLVCAFFFYFKKLPTSLVSTLTIPTGTTYQSPVAIDFEFLKSSEFESLESFPDYSQFRPSDGLGIKTGRSNPFIPPTGMSIQSSTQSNPSDTIE